MDQNIEDIVSVALLKQQVNALDEKIDTHIDETKESMKTIQDTQDEILKELAIFTTTIKTGKYIIISILLFAGALGHKGWEWASKIISQYAGS